MLSVEVHTSPAPELVEQIFELWNSEYPMDFQFSSIESFQSYLSDLSNVEHLIHAESGNLLAWLMLFSRNSTRQFGMCVQRNEQGKGIGTELLKLAMHRESKLYGWVLTQNNLKKSDQTSYTLPLEFYSKMGFEITDETWDLSPIPAQRILWENTNEYQVTELSNKHLDQLLDYWFGSSDEHLLGMGVDLDKMPKRSEFKTLLQEQISLPSKQKSSFALIWLLNGIPVGHSNVNQIEPGFKANMHLHLWQGALRRRNIGSSFIQLCLPVFFSELGLEKIICEPYALNEAPNQLLSKMGFKFIQNHTCTPGSINFEQEVNQWEINLKDVVIPLPSLT